MNRRMWAVAATGGVALLCGGFLLTNPERYETGVGERRTVVLKDGSRISLNTASRIHVRWTPSRRIVELETGEALFEVAKDPRRPFVAVANGVEVRAIGTSFVVRSDAGEARRDEASGGTSVTLIEGTVVVTQVSGKNERVSPVSPMSPMSSVMAVEMLPGERLRIALAPGLKSAEVAKDRPRIDQVTAWQRGRRCSTARRSGRLWLR
ncbi:FecR family protein [Roseateles chitinivorans]|uniref:FecR family protein n=1 Tax=Roseateles chitinivorans TaxID=2917965 RepID=UPI003D66746B